MTFAGLARSRPFSRSRSVAVALLARLVSTDLKFGLLAKSRFLKGQRNVAASIAATLCAAAPSTANVPAKKVAEDVAKNVIEIGKVCRIKTAKSAGAVHSGMAELVIAGSLVRIHQDAVRLSAFLELFFRLSIPRIAVRMVLHGQLAIGTLDLLLRGRTGHA